MLVQTGNDYLLSIAVTLDESNRTWGRSTIYKPEEFEDAKKGIKKKVRTWGPSSIQTKERGNCAERFTSVDLFSFHALSCLIMLHTNALISGGT